MGCGASTVPALQSPTAVVPNGIQIGEPSSANAPSANSETNRNIEAGGRRFSEDATYDLKDPDFFRAFLLAANIRPVRAEYLWHLAQAGRAIPRRQEAELETFSDGKGQQVTALVTREEISEWEETDAFIISVSHVWEALEHPDPCGHQLRTINDYTSLHYAAYGVPVWIFYDYLSLFQFPRRTREEQTSFRRSMANMHILYCHECTDTVRVETLTPASLWQERLDTTLNVWHEPSRSVRPRLLRELTANSTPYEQRGWCTAEVEWSSARSQTVQNLRIDRTSESGGEGQAPSSKVPTPPELFKERLGGLKFTHRSDLESVVQLQRKVYHAKVVSLEEAVFHNLEAEEFELLARGFHHYEHLRSLELLAFKCNVEAAEHFGQAMAASTSLRRLKSQRADPESALILAKALAEALKHNSSVKELDLQYNQLGDEGAEALAKALHVNITLKKITFANNLIGAGSQALGQALKDNHSLTEMDLGCNRVGDDEVQVFAMALKTNRKLKQLGLGGNLITNAGVEALAEALQVNRTVTEIDLQYNEISEVGMEALQDALQVHKALKLIASDKNLRYGVTEASLATSAKQEPGSRQFRILPRLEVLSEALEVNRSVTAISLIRNDIGDEGAQALAKALAVNKCITKVNLRFNSKISEVGAKALEEACEVNRLVQIRWR